MPEPNLLPSSHRLLPAGLSTAPVAALCHGLSMRPGLATLNNHSRSLGLDTSVGESESESAQGCSAGSADLLAKAETFTTSVRLRLQAPFHLNPRWFEITPRKWILACLVQPQDSVPLAERGADQKPPNFQRIASMLPQTLRRQNASKANVVEAHGQCQPVAACLAEGAGNA